MRLDGCVTPLGRGESCTILNKTCTSPCIMQLTLVLDLTDEEVERKKEKKNWKEREETDERFGWSEENRVGWNKEGSCVLKK